VHEVSSLAQDEADPDAARRYKVFTHSYLVLGKGQAQYDLGYIGLFTAPAPEGPWQDEGNVLGWKGEGLISQEGAGTLAAGFPATAACVALTEPGAYVTGGVIDLALGCVYLEGGEDRIKIVVMRTFDHARTFSYSATLLDAQDGPCLGGTRRAVNAPHLFTAGGKRYASVSPAGPVADFVGYRGCAIVEVTSSGAVRRDAEGRPEVVRLFDRPTPDFIGACAYAEGATAMGYLLPLLRLDRLPRLFRLYPSGVAAP
jgi:hypothetical protein